MYFFRSKAEVASVRRAILYEFPFGVQYAWMILIFAMTIIYSVSCPLITPFGKHLFLKIVIGSECLYSTHKLTLINQVLCIN